MADSSLLPAARMSACHASGQVVALPGAGEPVLSHVQRHVEADGVTHVIVPDRCGSAIWSRPSFAPASIIRTVAPAASVLARAEGKPRCLFAPAPCHCEWPLLYLQMSAYSNSLCCCALLHSQVSHVWLCWQQMA